MSKPRPDCVSEHSPSRLPPDLQLSTVGEITSWLVGHTVESVERELILQTLAHCDGNRFWAASILGTSAEALEEKLHAYAKQGFTIPERGGELAEEGEAEADAEDELSTEPAVEAVDGRPQATELPGQFQSGSRGGARWVAAIAALAIALGAAGFHMAGGSEAIAALFGAETTVLVEAPAPEKPPSEPPALPRLVTATAPEELALPPAAAPVQPSPVAAPPKEEPKALPAGGEEARQVEDAPKAEEAPETEKAREAEEVPKAEEALDAQVPAEAEPDPIVSASIPLEAENPAPSGREPVGAADAVVAAIMAAVEPESAIAIDEIPLILPPSAPLPSARPSPEQPARPRVTRRAPAAPAKEEENPLRSLFSFGNRDRTN